MMQKVVRCSGHPQIIVYTHTHTYTCAHTHTRTHTHMRTHTRTHIWFIFDTKHVVNLWYIWIWYMCYIWCERNIYSSTRNWLFAYALCEQHAFQQKIAFWEIVLLSREVQPRSNHGVALTPGQRTEMDGRADWGETCAMRGLKISQHMQLEEFLGHSYKKPPETTGAMMNSSQITEVCSLRSDVFKCLFRCVIFAQICFAQVRQWRSERGVFHWQQLGRTGENHNERKLVQIDWPSKWVKTKNGPKLLKIQANETRISIF